MKEILESLESGKSFDMASDTIEDKELLKEKIIDIRNNINNTLKDIEDIKEDETFIIIQDNDDLEIYFKQLQDELEAEYNRLNHIDNQAQSEKESIAKPKSKSKSKSKSKKETTEEDSFWESPF